MDLSSLHIFKTVVEEGGVVAAARKLHRVQSNVTVRIQQLEASLGVKLFVRENRRLRLTPSGEVFLDYAQRILKLSDQARQAVLGDSPQGTLRLGTMESTAASRLPPLLSSYHRRYPTVRVELETGTTDALVEGVVARRFEAAFIAGKAQGSGLSTQPVFQEQLVVITPRFHPKVTSAEDLRSATLITFPMGCAYRRVLQSWFADAGVMPDRTLELGSYHAIVACVASGAGIAVVPRSVLETVQVNDSIQTCPLPERWGKQKTYLVWRREDTSPAFKALQAEARKASRHASSSNTYN